MEDELTIRVGIMKDCIEKLLDEGCAEFQFDWDKHAIRIAMELKRLKYPKKEIRRILEDWAKKSAVSDLTVQKRVPDLVEWVLRKGTELGCRGVLVEEGLCIKGGNPHHCEYDRMYQDKLRARKLVKTYSEKNWEGWSSWLKKNEKRFGALAVEIYIMMRKLEYYQGAVIYVSYRQLGEEIKNRFKNWNPAPMTVLRATRCLEGHRLVKIVSRGKKGTKSGIANGYLRTLPIPEPPD